MKIKSDFVTNSSSTSFIFGSLNNATESVESVYSFIRIIVSELCILFENIADEIFQNNYNEEDYDVIFNKHINNSIFIIIPNFNYYMEDYQYLLATVKGVSYYDFNMFRTEYHDILNNESYEQYLKYTNKGINIYDVNSQNDINELTACLEYFGDDYLDRNNINVYRDSFDLAEKIINKKEFLLNHMGSVVVFYKEIYFDKIFYIVLDYFSNYSYSYEYEV